ncbi:rod shape-determining protein MreC [Tunturibacter empetritectus]|uniref:Cell shape-determining protein MreC n=1 Tax=Tunturiibacter lichenicola TaxID=2051959 RepID=A0A7W8JAA3_9BACT|nr:rod shape-determining protein MreC [Edaphobacter lichenicola]MBB5345592.1 rod shape-determining protein MreC [Edaphobacter lichenicola]
MESFFTRFKNVLVLVAILLAQTIGLAVQVRRPVESGAPDSSKVTLIRYWAVSVVTPFERFFHGIGYTFRHGWSNYVDLRHTRQENHDLQEQIARLRLEQASFAEDAMQGHRLQAMLDFQQHYVSTTVAAQVIGTSGNDLSRVVYIDKGAKDGLKADQAVITPDGIVGKIRDVFPHTSQVLLINDQTSGAGVLLATTRIRAILRGSTTGQILINNLTPDDRIKPGEQVLSSGGDQVYPRGLPVGTIESIKVDPDHQPYTLIQLRPAANLNQLEEVLVITGTQTTLPAAAQKDLAAGAATAEAQATAKQLADQQAAEAAARSAAQIVADRLPSIHEGDDDTTKTGASATPAAKTPPVSVVPKPLPTLHSDRYSPGATPPAVNLRPGAPEAANPVVPQTPTPDATTQPATPKPAQPRPRKSQPPPDSAQPPTQSPNPQP